MNWKKKSLIFNPCDNTSGWITNYASLPVADFSEENTLRIYFSTRDQNGRSLITYLETDPECPENIHYIHGSPILDLGDRGTFDDNGMMPSWITTHDGIKYLYYIGWNPQVTVSYRLAIGLAISRDNGKTFERHSMGPLLDRSADEPYFNTAPCVLKTNSSWIMWYVSCTGWNIIKGHPEPSYNIKYAVSRDGINWRRTGETCINYDEFTQAIGKPCVYYENSIYKMIYSYRRTDNYRTNPDASYRLGYAESVDGKIWVRKDGEIGISLSDSGWDSQMIEYSTTYKYRNTRYLIYNGNTFGKSGFGYAVLES